ncbi:hypothetical protein K8I28_05865 [bacterium]|nr:hypothetical protein [bacterium]
MSQKVFICCLFTLLLVSVGLAQSEFPTQTLDTTSVSIQELDRQIMEAEQQKSSGTMMAVLGGVSCAVGFAFIPYTTYDENLREEEHGNAPMYYLLEIGGATLLTAGLLKSSKAKDRITALNHKKMMMSLNPQMYRDGVGVCLSFRF